MDVFSRRTAAPMLIGLERPPFDDPGYIFELKLDGVRCLAYLDREATLLVNRRKASVAAKFPELAGLHRQVNGKCILDGELVVVSADGRPDFEAIMNRSLSAKPLRIRQGSEKWPATFIAFDILYLDGRALDARPLMHRRAELENTVTENERLVLSRYIEEKGKDYFDQVRQLELEGIIAKKRDSLYHFGKRTREWVKIKNQMEDDFVIAGYTLTDNPVASLILGQYDAGGGLIYKGRVTVGLRSGDFKIIQSQRTASRHPFTKTPPAMEGITWIRPDLVCLVSFVMRTPGGGLRQPIFKGLRPDKKPEEAIDLTQYGVG